MTVIDRDLSTRAEPTKEDEHAYAAPAVIWEEWLDVKATLVMACAKVNPGAGPPCSSGLAAS